VVACLLVFALAHSASAGSGMTANQFVARADSARSEGSFDIELAALHHARAKDSTNVETLWRLTRAYVELGELASEKSQKRKFYAAGIGHGQAAIAADSESCIAFTWLSIAEGTTATVVGFKEQVRLAWQIREHALEAIQLDPESDIAYHVMARWHAEIASIGGLKRTMANLLFGDLPKASYEESIAYYRRAIELHDQIHHRLELAKVYLRMEDYIVAQRELEDVLAMRSERRLDDKYKDEARLLLAHLP
jgi:tetratricopeptide (TPR) repeat protein